jgi:hypothetical protein
VFAAAKPAGAEAPAAATRRPADELAYLNPDPDGEAFLHDWGSLPVPESAG